MRPLVHRRSQSGQTFVEFGLCVTIMMIMFMGMADFGLLFAGRIDTTAAVRNGSRYAAAHPLAYSKSTNPPQNSIQGRLVLTAVPVVLPNNDSSISVRYYIPDTTASGTLCGTYTTTGSNIGDGTHGGITFQSGYSFTNCVIPLDIIQVQATYTYHWITPYMAALFPNVTIVSRGAEIEES